MLHPVGSQPPGVYWRRRLFLLASIVALVVLVVMTVKIATSSGHGRTAAGPTPTVPSAGDPNSTRPHSTSAASTKPRSSSSRPPSSKAPSSAPPAACTAKDRSIQAVVEKNSYRVGDRPMLQLQVTDISGHPCVQDLADQQVELKVYNGESRVWGSHDCKIEPGTDPRTLIPHQAVRVSISWSGLSSQAGCAGTRQRVSAGTYTLYATLSGQTGKAAQFRIT